MVMPYELCSDLVDSTDESIELQSRSSVHAHICMLICARSVGPAPRPQRSAACAPWHSHTAQCGRVRCRVSVGSLWPPLAPRRARQTSRRVAAHCIARAAFPPNRACDRRAYLPLELIPSLKLKRRRLSTLELFHE
eukprot:6996118-Prymnesium_polylepis.1